MKPSIRPRAKPVRQFASQEEFIEAVGAAVEQWEDGLSEDEAPRPLYALVLGAGASRSAGIPLQAEMKSALEQAYATFLRRFPEVKFDPTPLFWWDELEPHLFMACLARANREPNLTHLLAADLAAVGIMGPILTTNFDDLMPAGFWALHERTMHVEPHIVYDVKQPAAPRRIRHGVPVVLKVHGHHTTYSVARFRQQVRRLIPSVVKHYRQSVRPTAGFIVAGYSGAWNDGILAILSRKELVRGKTVYWLFRGEPPALQGRLRTVAGNCKLRFVRIEDTDRTFLRLWEDIGERCAYLGDKLLDIADVLAPIPMSVRQTYWAVATDQPQWRHGIEYVSGMTAEQYWTLPAVKALQATLLPLLHEIEALDHRILQDELNRLVRSGLVLRPTLTRNLLPDDDACSLDEIKLSDLVARLPSGLEWTRRNRVVFRLALEGHMDHLNSIELLEIIQKLSEQAQRIGGPGPPLTAGSP